MRESDPTRLLIYCGDCCRGRLSKTNCRMYPQRILVSLPYSVGAGPLYIIIPVRLDASNTA